MYTVVGATKSRTLRVLWLLEELELNYTHLPAAPRSDEVKELNPLGKIPVLLDGDTAISDSVAIMTYLADKHGSFTFPAGTPERARQDALTNFLINEMDALLWSAAKHTFALPDAQRMPAIKDSLKWEFEQAQDHFSNFLGDQPFLMGNTPTIPDILAGHLGGWAVNARFPVTNLVFREFVDMMRARPAFRRAARN
jgi:glutathione S-transferase